MGIHPERLHQVRMRRHEAREVVRDAMTPMPRDFNVVRLEIPVPEREVGELVVVERIYAPGPRLGEAALRVRGQRREAALAHEGPCVGARTKSLLGGRP